MAERPPGADPPTETVAPPGASGGVPPAGRQPIDEMSFGKGSALGRYVLLEPIGGGGGGQVFAAYDPELDRRVAVKVLHPDSGSPKGLLREARALARLQHPNVLTVHDIGVVDGRVFLATELLTGSTVAQWVREEPRPWTEVVEIFLGVARGLAAAHEQGLVHRDVKPSNMMIARGGEGLLVDFGIARDLPDPEDAVPLEILEESPLAARRRGPAVAGDRSGTPGFMAPEQAAGDAASPAMDQYSFCVSLYWGLSGSLPQGPSPRLPGVPSELETLVQEGLAQEPGDRHPSMVQLTEQLAAILAHRRRRPYRWLLGACVLLGAAAAWGWLTVSGESCSGGQEQLAEIWNPERQGDLRAKLLAEEPLSGEAVWRTVSRIVGDYGEAWSSRRTTWCRAERRGDLSRELLDLRVDCADRRLRELEASLALAGRRTDLGPDAWMALFDGLKPLSSCDDGRTLRSLLPAPADGPRRERLAELHQEQAEIHALWAAGDLRPGLERSRRLVDDARQLGWGPLVAEGLYQRGLFEDALVEADARDTLEDAALTAAAARHDRLTAQSLVRLVRLAAVAPESNADPDRGDTSSLAGRAASRAQEALAGLGDPALLEAELFDYRGLAARQGGDYDAALVFHRRALELKTAEVGPQHPTTAGTLLRLGNLYDDLDDHPEAYKSLHRALEIHTRRFGPSHRIGADIHSRLGTIALEDGDRDLAEHHHRRALDIRLQVFGADGVPVAESLTYLGELEALGGDTESAARSFERALRVLEGELGPDHPHLAVALSTVARSWTETGKDRQALEPYRRALAILTDALGAEHPQVAVLVFNLATVQLRLGELEPALRGFRRSGESWSASLGPEHPLVANARIGEADCLERLDRPAAALEALGNLGQPKVPQVDNGPLDKWQGDAAFVRARAAWATGIDAAGARRLGEAARGIYLHHRVDSARELAEVDGWLAALPEGR